MMASRPEKWTHFMISVIADDPIPLFCYDGSSTRCIKMTEPGLETATGCDFGSHITASSDSKNRIKLLNAFSFKQSRKNRSFSLWRSVALPTLRMKRQKKPDFKILP